MLVYKKNYLQKSHPTKKIIYYFKEEREKRKMKLLLKFQESISCQYVHGVSSSPHFCNPDKNQSGNSYYGWIGWFLYVSQEYKNIWTQRIFSLDYHYHVKKVEKRRVLIGNKIILVSNSNTFKNAIGIFQTFFVHKQNLYY